MKAYRIQDNKGKGYYFHPKLTPHFQKDSKLTDLTNRISSDLYGGMTHKKGVHYAYTTEYTKTHKKDMNEFVKYTNTKYKTTFKVKPVNINKKNITFGDKDQIQYQGGK